MAEKEEESLKVGSSEQTSSKKNEPKSEKVENIVAVSVFFVLILIVVALFTNGFGLWAPKPVTLPDVNTVDRITVDLSNAPIRGDPKAPVKIVVFSDFECPFCKDAEAKMNNIMQKYSGKVVYIFKNFPLTSIHPFAYDAALAAKCAQEQDKDKYWQYHDYLFAHNDQLGVQYLEEYAKDLGFKTDQFNTCLESKKYSFEVDRDAKDGAGAGVSSTPTFFINGIKVVGDLDQAEFEKIIDGELKIAK